MLDFEIANLIILMYFVVLKKPEHFHITFFASKMEYYVLILQRYIERSSQLLSSVKKALATAVLYAHINMGTTTLSYVKVWPLPFACLCIVSLPELH